MYDVIVAADDKEAERIVKGMLEVPVSELPQSEPSFNVMTSGKSTLTNATKYARNIVVVRTGGNTKVKYEYDAFAIGQIVVYISVPSAKAMRADSAKIADGLRLLLDQAELGNEVRRLNRHHNQEATKLIEKTFGCTVMIPEDMGASKVGRYFVWLSNNGNRAMTNICIYSYPCIKLDKDIAIAMRDSIMGANIKGEEISMHMQTETAVAPTAKIGYGTMTLRGLWAMKGDAMGGPFVSVSKVDSQRGRTVVAEGFVYAPGQKKKILIKQLEAAITTLTLHTKQ